MKQARLVIYEAIYQDTVPSQLEKFLKETAGISGRSLRQYFFKGLVEVNRRKAHSAAKLKPGDEVRVFQLKEGSSLTPEAQPIAIVYENEELLVINKPALLPVHPSGSITSGTLANRVAYYFEQKELPLKVRPVNRLDYGTSGLIIFAKSAESQEKLSQAIQTKLIDRIYYAVVQGVPAKPEGKIDLPVTDDPHHRKVASGGKSAVTHFRVLETFANAALLELSLQTGRTHQIRIHLSHIGHPIIGDNTYGTSSNLIKRPALHAGKLIFKHSQFTIPELNAALPEDMERLLGSTLETTLLNSRNR